MPPRRSSKRTRNSAGESSTDYAEIEAGDPDRFDCREAERRYENDFHHRTVLHEHFLLFTDRHRRLAMVLAEIDRRGWRFLREQPQLANISLVREFYANYHDIGATHIHLRSSQVEVTPQAVAFTLEIPLPDDHSWEDKDEYEHVQRSPSVDLLEQVRARLCVEGSHWETTAAGVPKLLSSRYITLEARAWARAVFSHILPNSHHSDITIKVALLIYFIMEGYWINLPQIICSRMSKVHNAVTSRGLPYPALITSMALQAGVRVEDGDLMQPSLPQVGVQGLVVRHNTEKNRREQAATAAAPNIADAPDIASDPPTDAPGASSSSSPFDAMCSTLMAHMDTRFDRMQAEILTSVRREMEESAATSRREMLRRMRALLLDPHRRDVISSEDDDEDEDDD